MRRGWAHLWAVGLLIGLIDSAALAQTPALALSVGSPENGWPVVVEVGPVLDDPALRGALESALPLRFHLRVELWRNGILDRLVTADEVSLAVLQDPLGEGFSIETATSVLQIDSIGHAQATVAELLQSDIRPQRPGRHYYLATLEVETLSLSDLDELRRWLRGDVSPAIGGQSSPTRAVERGLRRLMVRVIGLPTRRFEARTGTFRSE